MNSPDSPHPHHSPGPGHSPPPPEARPAQAVTAWTTLQRPNARLRLIPPPRETGGHAGSRPAPGLPACSPWMLAWFSRYARRFLRRHFRAMRLARGGRPRWTSDRPLVVFLNHPSWWDPLVCMTLARTLFPGKRIYAPMAARQLQRYRLFARLGFFGVETDTLRGARAFLETSSRILSEPDAMLWLTPQGALVDARRRPVRLESGLGHLARHVPDAQFLPLALEYGYWNERLPEILVRFGDPIVPADLPAGRPRARHITDTLAEHLQQTMDRLAMEGMSREPARFETLWERGCGVNGWYDLWRRARAACSGHRFHPDHEGDLP